MIKDVNNDRKFGCQIFEVILYVCTLSRTYFRAIMCTESIAVRKPHDSLIYIYEEYNSLSEDSILYSSVYPPPFRTQYLLRMQLQNHPYKMFLELQQWLEKATDNTLF